MKIIFNIFLFLMLISSGIAQVTNKTAGNLRLADKVIVITSLSGQADKYLKVNGAGTDLEFGTVTGGPADTSHYSIFDWIIGLQDTVNKFLERGDSIIYFTQFDAISKADISLLANYVTITNMNDSNFVKTSETTNWDKTASDDLLKSEFDDSVANYINNTAYNATSWDNNLDAPTKNAVRDKFESLDYPDTTSELTEITNLFFTDERAQDAVGSMINTAHFTYTDASNKLDAKVQMSVTSDASGIKLDGDASSPGNSKYYGTNSGGTKGYYDLPGGSSPTGIYADVQFTVLQGDGNLSEASGVQTWAGSDRTTQDVFTVAANTTYLVEGQYIINTGATTHTTAMAWSTAATITRFEYTALLWSAAANTIATGQSTTHVTGVASKVLNATSTAVYTIIKFTGILVVGSTAGGSTITPQINFSANPTGSCLMKAGSFIKMTRLGADTVIEAGGWE